MMAWLPTTWTSNTSEPMTRDERTKAQADDMRGEIDREHSAFSSIQLALSVSAVRFDTLRRYISAAQRTRSVRRARTATSSAPAQERQSGAESFSGDPDLSPLAAAGCSCGRLCAVAAQEAEGARDNAPPGRWRAAPAAEPAAMSARS